MPSEITQPPPGLVPVWRLQWAEPRTLRQWGELGIPMVTNCRLERIVNDAYSHGWESGEQQGRANLRIAIENGTVEPIEASALTNKEGPS
jgi:hypothetical protein